MGREASFVTPIGDTAETSNIVAGGGLYGHDGHVGHHRHDHLHGPADRGHGWIAMGVSTLAVAIAATMPDAATSNTA